MRKKGFFYCFACLAIIIVICLFSGCSNQKGEGDSSSVMTDNAVSSSSEEMGNSDKSELDKSSPESSDGEDSDNEKSTSAKTAENLPKDSLTPKSADAKTATLMITKDFGTQKIVEKKVAIQNNWTIFDLLDSTVKIDSKWDGGFVNAIDGLESKSAGFTRDGFDWFYFINGMCADVGADQYDLRPGEVIWWDYHVWKTMGSTNSAVIGCYPEPFINGYRGKIGTTNILVSNGNMKMAEDLKSSLAGRGVKSIAIKNLENSLLEKRQGPTIVIGTWDQLKQLDWLNKFNNAYRKTGTSVYFSDKGLELLDYCGNTKKTMKNAGIITATGNGLGDSSPLWLVCGTEQMGLQLAVDLLVKNPAKISCCYGVAVAADKVYRLPLQ